MLIERFRKYLDSILKHLPESTELYDLREEMLGNLMSHAMELQGEGLSEDGIFDKCVENMGDYTETLKALKVSPFAAFKDRRTQACFLFAVLGVLLAVTLYLVLGFTLNAWGKAAVIIFPTMAGLLYVLPTGYLIARNVKLKRYFWVEPVLVTYSFIFPTALFFLLTFGCKLSAGVTWCVFPWIPALAIGSVIFSVTVIRKKKFPFALALLELPFLAVGVYLTAAAVTGLYHPLWILFLVAVVIDVFLLALRRLKR